MRRTERLIPNLDDFRAPEALSHPYNPNSNLVSNLFSFWTNTEVLFFPSRTSAQIALANSALLLALVVLLSILPQDGNYTWWFLLDCYHVGLNSMLRLLYHLLPDQQRRPCELLRLILKSSLLAGNIFGLFFIPVGGIVYIISLFTMNEDSIQVVFIIVCILMYIIVLVMHMILSGPLIYLSRQYLITSQHGPQGQVSLSLSLSLSFFLYVFIEVNICYVVYLLL